MSPSAQNRTEKWVFHPSETQQTSMPHLRTRHCPGPRVMELGRTQPIRLRSPQPSTEGKYIRENHTVRWQVMGQKEEPDAKGQEKGVRAHPREGKASRNSWEEMG